MQCVELTVQLENSPTERHSIERRSVESLRAALTETLDATIRSFHEQGIQKPGLFSEYTEHLHSDLEFSSNGCMLVFQLRHAEPVSCRLFEQFATDLIQCAASTYLLADFGLGVDALLPHLYEDKVLLFWGSFTKHAPSSPLLTKLGLYSSSCRFEKTLDPTEYGTWVTTFDRLIGGMASVESAHGDSQEASADSTHAGSGRQGENRIDPLAAVAEAQDEDAFVRALCEVSRKTLEQDGYVRLIRLALAAGAHRSARELAGEAQTRFPRSEELVRFAAVLGAPEFVAQQPVAHAAVDEQAWVKRNAPKFGGHWVALRGGDLLASGSSLSEVRDAIGSLAGLFVTRIP